MRKKTRTMSRATLLGLALILVITGCNPIPRSVTKEADLDLSFTEIREVPEQHLGTVVLLGGTIVGAESRQGETFVEVQEEQLGMSTEPRAGGRTGGRFLAVFEGPLDPTEYKEGRRITIAGTIQGKGIRPSGPEDHVYPVIRAEDSFLWAYCGDDYYPYSFYYYYFGNNRPPFHRAHYYSYRCH